MFAGVTVLNTLVPAPAGWWWCGGEVVGWWGKVLWYQSESEHAGEKGTHRLKGLLSWLSGQFVVKGMNGSRGGKEGVPFLSYEPPPTTNTPHLSLPHFSITLSSSFTWDLKKKSRGRRERGGTGTTGLKEWQPLPCREVGWGGGGG
eukprot:Sspe_Gene.39354::Locus_18984_Transcript_1_1_Confidence_1.000_Length_472::g.39354::m.39354